jgi:N-acyl-D-aspartate/D-glutamate deacylase
MAADLTIRNARVIDGSGTPAFAADVAIVDGLISSVGEAERGTLEIDARGQVLSPGFVDTHSHDDGAFIRYPGMEFKLAQGVTTVVSGNCGFSAGPARPGSGPPAGGALVGMADWTDLTGYFQACEALGPAINNIMLVGHNTVRALAMGNEPREPTDRELADMRSMVREAMEQGACGFSTGLIYEPGRYSATPEVLELAREAAAFGGVYATHMRNEGDRLLEAVEETLAIGAGSGCPVHISHHKSAGRANWGRVKDSLARIDKAVAAGQSVTLDVYPYTAGSGPMFQYFNLDAISHELAAAIRIAACPDHRDWEGRMLTEIAAAEGVSLDDAVRGAVTGPRGRETICIQFTIDEADVATNLRHPLMMVGSDGIPNLSGSPHPRLFGTFPRILARYVREQHVLTLEDAVHRMTRMSCERFGIANRGLVKAGSIADLVLFDPDTVEDLATYDEPKREPKGISNVIVKGQVAYQDGHHTHAGSGQMLRYLAASAALRNGARN